MTLLDACMTPTQKKMFLIGLVAVLPAYWFANGRHADTTSSLQATLARENQILESDRKLLEVCKETGFADGGSFGTHAVLCRQAKERQKTQESVFQKLEEEQHKADRDRYWNFVWFWLMLNAAAQLAMRWAVIRKTIGD